MAGETKYPLAKMLRLAIHGIVGFSDAPLRLAIWFGLAVSACALLYGTYVIGLWVSGGGHLITGWTSTVVIVSFLCGINMLMTGFIGLYVGRIHAEVKRRPLYVVDKRVGFDRPQWSGKETPARIKAGSAGLMTELFDTYGKSYRDVVQSSIDFSGLPYDFFTQAKADLLGAMSSTRTSEPARSRRCSMSAAASASLHPFVRDRFVRLCGVGRVGSEHCAGARYPIRPWSTAPTRGCFFRAPIDEFDVVFAACVMHHVPPGTGSRSCARSRRVVRPGRARLHRRAQSVQSADPACGQAMPV